MDINQLASRIVKKATTIKTKKSRPARRKKVVQKGLSGK